MDNESAHRGLKAVKRLQDKHANLTLVHDSIHASWLNQIEIHFSILHRKALTPNDFPSLAALKERILSIQEYYEEIAKPFEWKFTRKRPCSSNVQGKQQTRRPLPASDINKYVTVFMNQCT